MELHIVCKYFDVSSDGMFLKARFRSWSQLKMPRGGTCVLLLYTLVLPLSVMRVMNLALGRDANADSFSDFFFASSLLDHLEAAIVAATAALGFEEEEGLAARLPDGKI